MQALELRALIRSQIPPSFKHLKPLPLRVEYWVEQVCSYWVRGLETVQTTCTHCLVSVPCPAHSYRLGTKRQCLLRMRKATREFPKPRLSIIIVVKPSKCSAARVLSAVPFHHIARQYGSTFFHLSFLSFFHPVKNESRSMLLLCTIPILTYWSLRP